jgi:hypothetical protein
VHNAKIGSQQEAVDRPASQRVSSARDQLGTGGLVHCASLIQHANPSSLARCTNVQVITAGLKYVLEDEMVKICALEGKLEFLGWQAV